jgi:hypothetical protein
MRSTSQRFGATSEPRPEDFRHVLSSRPLQTHLFYAGEQSVGLHPPKVPRLHRDGLDSPLASVVVIDPDRQLAGQRGERSKRRYAGHECELNRYVCSRRFQHGWFDGAAQSTASGCCMTLGSIRPHNLLKIDTAAISFADTRSDQNIPLSVLRELDEIQLVVVRRAPMTQDLDQSVSAARNASKDGVPGVHLSEFDKS